MKTILSLLFLFTFSSLSVWAQTGKTTNGKTTQLNKKKFTDAGTGFQLEYPEALIPIILKENEDIKEQIEPFVIEIYKEQEAPMKVNGKAVLLPMDAVPDDCYVFNKVYTNHNKIELDKFSCEDGAAGTTYFSYIYVIKKTNYNVVLKFIHKHCNSCVDAQGKPKEFNEAKDTRWILDIVETAQFVK